MTKNIPSGTDFAQQGGHNDDALPGADKKPKKKDKAKRKKEKAAKKAAKLEAAELKAKKRARKLAKQRPSSAVFGTCNEVQHDDASGGKSKRKNRKQKRREPEAASTKEKSGEMKQFPKLAMEAYFNHQEKDKSGEKRKHQKQNNAEDEILCHKAGSLRSERTTQDRKHIIFMHNDKDDDSMESNASSERKDTGDKESKSDGVESQKKRRKKSSALQKPYECYMRSKKTYTCSNCGRADFRSKTGAMYHLRWCLDDKKGNPTGPWRCPTCLKTDFTTSQAFQSHIRCCYTEIPASSTGERAVALNLRPTCLEEKRKLLSDYNYLATECIELVEASAKDVEMQAGRNRRHEVRRGDIGIRCMYCSKSNVVSSASVMYPVEIKNLPHNLYLMMQRHLLSSCMNIPAMIRGDLICTKKTSTSQSLCKTRIGLPTYLKLLQETIGLQDRGNRDGIICVAA